MAKFVFIKKGNRTINKPMYFAIGLLMMLIIIAIIYFIFLKYSPIMNFKYGGYAISGKEVTENLLGSSGDEENGANKNIELTKIEEQGLIFKKLNSFFVGDKNKTEINLEYPIYINENSAIYNLSEDAILISKDFEEVSGYPNLSISEGKVYDGNNLERADGKEYIFVKTSEGIYINLQEIKLKTVVNEYTIPVNSIIAFSENGIRYYSVKNNVLVFNEIKDLDNNTNVQIVENNYTYKDLLTRLGIIKETPQNNENTNEQESGEQEVTANSENKDENNEENEQNENTDNSENNTTENTNNTADNNQDAYIKPEVSCEEFTVEVYTATSTLHINDPAGRIIEAPTFEIYKDGKIYLRRVYTNSGTIQITGLLPDTEYEIKGKYIYLNENGQKIENQFYEGKFTTKGYDALGSIDIQKENGEIFSNKIQIQKVKITSDLNAEVLKGVNQVEIVTGDIRTVLKNNQINELLQGKEITIESSEGLQSNSKIDYEIKFYDRNGVELKVNNNKGETRTSKQEPEVRVSIKEQNIVSVTLNLKLTNKDNVKLENYKYIVTKPNGEKVREEKLAENEKELILEDLDQNQYYTIKIYADFDLNDNRGKQENVEIGSLVFATQPISTLGSLDLNVENKELTGNSSTIDYTINEDRTDKRLIQILNELTIKIVEQPSNTNDSSNNENNINTNAVDEGNKEDEVAENDTSINKTNKEPIVVYTNTLTGDEITNLQQGNTKEIRYENLKSNTRYTIEITGEVKLGETEESIPITYTYKEFITLKIPAKVEIKNQFVTGNLIDFDVRIEDVDKSVLNEKVRMELRDEKDNLIDLQEITTNQDFIRKTYEKLEENHTYKLSFYADQYNEGSTDETYKINYLIKEIEIVTEPGISGQVGLTELTRKATGKNLVDMSSETKWYVYPNFNTNDYYGKEYDQQTKVLTLGGHGNWRKAVYDLREYAGQEVTMSFKAKNVNGSQNTYIQNSKTDTNRTKIEGLTNEWKDFQYTLTVDNTGYLGFCIGGGNGIQIKELQIELGNKKTSYEEYKYTLESKYSINLEDKRDEITTNDYYIKIYEDGNLVKTDRYEEIPENNIITNAIKSYDTESGKDYKVDLVIKVNDREYTISSLEYNTKDTEEIKGIYNKEDFLEIQPRGHYIVLGDIDLSGASGSECIFGNGNLPFEGIIDFNGYKLIRDYKNTDSSTIRIMSDTAIIENLVLDFYYDNNIEKYMYGLCSINYGTIRNVQVNIQECNNLPNGAIAGIVQTNYGIVENFAINLDSPIYVDQYLGLAVHNNYGVVKNGYLYGQPINVSNYVTSSKYIGGIVYHNLEGGFLENVYNLSDINLIQSKNDGTIGNIVGQNADNSLAKNMYSTGVLNNVTSPDNGPVIGSNITGASAENIYYFYGDIKNNTFNTKTTPLALYDKNFQNKILNSDNAFNVDELIDQGYYPQLIMPDCMPLQEYIALPEVEDADLPDILSTEVLEQGSNTVKVKFIVNNPASETITNISIENLDCKIESQEYKDGQSEVIATLTNPKIYTTNYSVLSITTKGAFSQEYTREYKDNERVIPVELFREIRTVDDWIGINKSPTENYMLMNDIDFINQGDNIRITSHFSGKLEGKNYTLKNINVNSFLFSFLYGKIQNINIENITIIQRKYDTLVGLIENGQNNIELNNVNIKNETIIANKGGCEIGGLIAWTQNTNIYNCSITNLNIVVNDLNSTFSIGGLVGYINVNTTINNSFAQNININETAALDVDGIGGIAGATYNDSSYKSIQNCYAVGNIQSSKGNVGGIVGQGEGINIKNCISKVNIVAQDDNVSGIIGNITTVQKNSNSDVTNNLALGNIYSASIDTANMKRIIGNQDDTENNYAYENQLINGEVSSDALGGKLISYKDIFEETTYTDKMNFENQYDLSELKQHILPKLKSTTGELLTNQQDNTIELENDIQLEVVEAEKTGSTTFTARVTLKNTSGVQINKIIVDGADVEITRNVNQNGYTYIDITGNVTKYFDNYRVEKVGYTDLDGKTKEAEINGKIELQFYKEIYNYNDWQSMDASRYQNYRLMADIDFSEKTNIKDNILVNRLETDGNSHTLKNINLEYSSSYNGLIKGITNTLENINFENITITNTSNDSSYIGVIVRTNMDRIKNVNVKNLNINAKGDYIGFICNAEGNEISNINFDTVNIQGNSYVGSLTGNLYVKNAENIYGTNININATGNRIGGIVGSIKNVESGKLNNVRIEENSVIQSKGNAVGGVIGDKYGNSSYRVTYVYAKDIKVKGKDQVGGIGGNLIDAYNLYADNLIIEGHSKVGGVQGSEGSIWNIHVQDCNIIATGDYVGGVSGQADYNFHDIEVINTKITSAGNYVGTATGNWKSANTGNVITNIYARDCEVEGNSYVGGLIGKYLAGKMYRTYNNSKITAINHTAGGIIGYLDNTNMTALNNTSKIYENYVAGATIKAQSNVGGIIGNTAQDLYMPENYYYSNYVEAYLESEDPNSISLGIGDRKNQNQYLKDTYYYKYSSINGENPTAQNEVFIPQDNYLIEGDLKQQTTYTSKLKWSATGVWDYSVITNNKYPTLKWTTTMPDTVGFELPTDTEHIIDTNGINMMSLNDDKEQTQEETLETTEIPEQSFEYEGKEIQTYSTYSVVKSEDGSSVRRNAKLYVKDNTLYAVPTVLSMGEDSRTNSESDSNNSSNNKVIPVANNLILDSYNGKEYETILGSDGRMYDLKEPINYPENFVNKDIESIGNNLNSDTKEIEVIYKNGDRVKFNYQTGEVIESNKNASEQKGLFEYIKEKLGEIGDSVGIENEEIRNKYEESKELQSKLEETPVEEAIEEQSGEIENNNGRNIENNNSGANAGNSDSETNIASQGNTNISLGNTAGTTTTETNSANNSNTEKKYISMYNEETGNYEIYDERELLDTTKEEVVSENEKIEANNLNKYYASEGNTKNRSMGILWIVLSIIGIGIILFVLKKNLKKKN